MDENFRKNNSYNRNIYPISKNGITICNLSIYRRDYWQYLCTV